METGLTRAKIEEKVKSMSVDFNYSFKETAVILAAGHGKRIKSQTSKMLHKIWEIPTVERVCNACNKALNQVNTVVVVGIKAPSVMEAVGSKSVIFAYQAEQNGTGHAVQVALQNIDKTKYEGIVYVFPGDMGLIDEATIRMFRQEFINSGSDMMVLTGLYEGNPTENSYGRIVRAKQKDDSGNSSGSDAGKVICIIEHKDILKIHDNEPLVLTLNGKKYSFTKKELIENNEFNSSVYAFKYKYLAELIDKIESNNAQKEIYLTDLIDLFNKRNLSVGAVSPLDQTVIMGFNNKSVLRQMDDIARSKVYEKLKDIIEIDDPEDFFIDENVVEEIIKMDKEINTLDIKLGKGVYIGKGAELNTNLTLKKNVYLSGNIYFGRNVTIAENAQISCYDEQKLHIKDNVTILRGNIIKGNTIIEENSLIESGVNITGSDEFPAIIGKNVTIKGTSYIFGCIVDSDVLIQHSVLIKKKVDRLAKKDGTVQPVRFILPQPEGVDAIESL